MTNLQWRRTWVRLQFMLVQFLLTLPDATERRVYASFGRWWILVYTSVHVGSSDKDDCIARYSLTQHLKCYKPSMFPLYHGHKANIATGCQPFRVLALEMPTDGREAARRSASQKDLVFSTRLKHLYPPKNNYNISHPRTSKIIFSKVPWIC